MNLLIAIIPAICWGINPLIISKIDSKPVNQLIGTGIGTLIVGTLVKVFMDAPDVSTGTFWLSLISGAAWIVGQLGQFIGYRNLGVSTTIPISTGLQLLGTSIIGVLFLGEWQSSLSKIIGFFAIILLVLGAVLTSITDKSSTKSASKSSLITLLATTVGYWIYSVLPKLTTADGLSIFFPQMLGMFLMVCLYALFKDRHAFMEKKSWQNTLPGLIYGIAALAYIFSAKANGVTTAYVLTQLNVVLSTLGGMLILHEVKSKRELRYTLSGLVLIVAGSVITALI